MQRVPRIDVVVVVVVLAGARYETRNARKVIGVRILALVRSDFWTSNRPSEVVCENSNAAANLWRRLFDHSYHSFEIVTTRMLLVLVPAFLQSTPPRPIRLLLLLELVAWSYCRLSNATQVSLPWPLMIPATVVQYYVSTRMKARKMLSYATKLVAALRLPIDVK